MGVPLLVLKAQNGPLRNEILAAIARVVDSQRFIMGPEVAALESQLAELLGVKHAVAVSSGTDALLLAMMALGISRGDEVITTAYSFFASASAIVRVGATPVFVDIDPATFNMDPARVDAAITRKTRAILPVHLFGLCTDMDPVLASASKAGVPVVEDAAQAIGATYKGRSAGAMGAIGCFSFFPSKNLGAFGDAGLLTTNDAALAAKARMLRHHGEEPRYHHHLVGANFRMDEIQAAVLRVKAPHLAAWTEARRRNASRYLELFQAAAIGDRVKLPIEPTGSRHIFNQFVIRTPTRDALKAHLDAQQIGNQIYYPLPLHLQPCFADLGYARGAFPEAERAASDSLALPVFSELTSSEQKIVVDAVASFVRNSAGAAL